MADFRLSCIPVGGACAHGNPWGNGIRIGAMRSLSDIKLISVVAPVYNEAEGVSLFVKEVIDHLEALSLPCAFEIVVADDGSTDGTQERLASLAGQYPAILRVVRLTRNFGFCAASTAAVEHASGDIVILMDADMQDDPASFPRFLDKWCEGYDVVYAVRVGRRDALLIRGLTWAFYRTLRLMAQIPLPLDAGTFALMDRKAVDALSRLGERNRYIPGLRCWIGYRQAGIPVERRKRASGGSRVGLRKLYDLGAMALFSFSSMPLFVFRFFGVGAILVALLIMLAGPAALLLGWMQWPAVAIAFSIAFFGGINLLGIWVLGEYAVLIYDEVRRRPLYLVDRVISSDSSSSLPADSEKG